MSKDTEKFLIKIKKFFEREISESNYGEFKEYEEKLKEFKPKYERFLEICAFYENMDDLNDFLKDFVADSELLGEKLNEDRIHYIAYAARSLQSASTSIEFKDRLKEDYKKYILNPLNKLTGAKLDKKYTEWKISEIERIIEMQKIITLLEKNIIIGKEQIEDIINFISSETVIFNNPDREILSEELITSEDIREFMFWILKSNEIAWAKKLSDIRQKEINEGKKRISHKPKEVIAKVEKPIITNIEFLNEEQKNIVLKVEGYTYDAEKLNSNSEVLAEEILSGNLSSSFMDIKDLIDSESEKFSEDDIVYLMKTLLSDKVLNKENSKNVFSIIENLFGLLKNIEELEKFEEENKDILEILKKLVDKNDKNKVKFLSYVGMFSCDDIYDPTQLKEEFLEREDDIKEYLGEYSEISLTDFFEFLCIEKISDLYLQFLEENKLESKKKILEQISPYIKLIEEYKNNVTPPVIDGNPNFIKHFIFLTQDNDDIASVKNLQFSDQGDKKTAVSAISTFGGMVRLNKNEILEDAVKDEKYKGKIWAFRKGVIRTVYLNLYDFLDDDIKKYTEVNMGYYLIIGQIIKRDNNQRIDIYEKLVGISGCNLISNFIEKMNIELRTLIAKYPDNEKTEIISNYFDNKREIQMKEYESLILGSKDKEIK